MLDLLYMSLFTAFGKQEKSGPLKVPRLRQVYGGLAPGEENGQ